MALFDEKMRAAPTSSFCRLQHQRQHFIGCALHMPTYLRDHGELMDGQNFLASNGNLSLIRDMKLLLLLPNEYTCCYIHRLLCERTLFPSIFLG